MAEGRIVVGDGARRWQADSGQILFDFEISEIARKAAPVARHAFREAKKRDVELRTAASGSPAGRDAEGMSAEDWYAWGCELEAAAPAEAREAYERALALDPALADARVNMGRLCHEAGDLLGAEEHYRGALACRPDHGTAAYDLGVVLQDLGLQDEAIDVYETAVRIDPGNADAHYNVARLYEDRGRNADAVRHLKAYRKLTMARRR
jgi:tetratricopeptide (TPR) repeat protein